MRLRFANLLRVPPAFERRAQPETLDPSSEFGLVWACFHKLQRHPANRTTAKAQMTYLDVYGAGVFSLPMGSTARFEPVVPRSVAGLHLSLG